VATDDPNKSQGDGGEDYPFLCLPVEINEAFVGRVVAPVGGVPFDGSQKFPEGVKPVDFRVGNYLLEFKGIEQDPLSVPERPARAVAFAKDKVRTGEAEARPGAKPGTGIVHLTGEASQEYWRKFLGASIGRQMEEAAKQIRSTRKFLKQPELRGAVFIVNQNAPFIDPQSFQGLVSAHRARFSDAIDIAIFFSRIPGVIEINGERRLCTAQGFFPAGTEHDQFGTTFLDQFEVQLKAALGREHLEQIPEGSILQPARLPLKVDLPGGKFVRFH
jgi:hypothetical protein